MAKFVKSPQVIVHFPPHHQHRSNFLRQLTYVTCSTRTTHIRRSLSRWYIIEKNAPFTSWFKDMRQRRNFAKAMQSRNSRKLILALLRLDSYDSRFRRNASINSESILRDTLYFYEIENIFINYIWNSKDIRLNKTHKNLSKLRILWLNIILCMNL